MPPKEAKVRPRYLVLRIASEDEVTRPQFIKAIRRAARTFGDDYYDMVGPWLTFFENNYGVVKYNHKMKAEMLALAGRIELPSPKGGNAGVEVLGISGTINKARKKYIP